MPSALAPRAESRTGTAAPIATPIIMGRAMSKRMAPVTARACRMPTAAEALWITLVKIRPSRMPSRGLENVVSILIKASLERSS